MIKPQMKIPSLLKILIFFQKTEKVHCKADEILHNFHSNKK